MTASIAPYAETQTAQEVLVKFLDWVGGYEVFGGGSILEIGCGAGHSTEQILKRMSFDSLLAIEPDPRYLQEAQNRLRVEVQANRVNFWQGQAQGLCDYLDEHHYFTPEWFIWANGIHYLQDREELADFFRTMNFHYIDGFFCTSFWQGSVDRRAFSVLGKMNRFALEHLGLNPKGEDVPSARRLHEWSLGAYEELARAAGYDRVDILQVPMQLPVDVYTGIAHDETWVNNALPPEKALAQFSQEERIEALVVGAQRAYLEAGVETTTRIWAFVHVAL